MTVDEAEQLEIPAHTSGIIDPTADSALPSVMMPLRGVFYPLGLPVEIVTNSAAVLEAAHESWGHRSPRHCVPMVQIRVEVHAGSGRRDADDLPSPAWRVEGHMATVYADEDNNALGNMKKGFAMIRLSEAATRNSMYIRYYFIEAIALVLLASLYTAPMHAACVSRRGRGVLLWGVSGTGKTTLAYACARAGWTLTSDDASYGLNSSISATARVAGNCHLVRFRPAAQNIFPELQGYKLTPRPEGKPSVEVPTADLPGLITAEEANIHHIIFLKREPSKRGELTPIPTGVGLQRFHENLYSPVEIRQRQMNILKNFANVESSELRYETLAQAIERLEWLTGGTSSVSQ